MVPTRLLLEGPDLEELLAKIKEEHGSSARIVSAERVRTGGLAGFFAKQRFEIAVDVLDPEEAGPGGSVDEPAAFLPPTADGLATLLARAELQERSLDQADRPPDRRNAARFAQVLAERAGDAARRTIEPAETGSPGVGAAPPRRGLPSGADGSTGRAAGIGATGSEGAARANGRPLLGEPSVAVKLAERARRRAAELAAEAAENEQRVASRRNGRIRVVAGPGSDPAAATPGVAPPEETPAAPEPAGREPAPEPAEDTAAPRSPAARSRHGGTGTDAGFAEADDGAVTAPVRLSPGTRPGPRPRTARGGPPATGRAAVPARPRIEPVQKVPPGDPPTAVQPVLRRPPKPSTRNGYDHPAVQLVRNGVPVHIAARAVGPDPWTAVARAVAGLPYPPALPSRPGEVLVIVGETESALLVAGQIAALSAGIDPAATLVAGSIAGTGLRRSHRISGPDEAIRRSVELRSSAAPRIVVVEATAGSPIGRPAALTPSADVSPHATIAALAPTQIWACVDATRKNADTARFLDALERIDALAVHGADETVEPGSVLHFGLPVVMLDGRPATARRWTTLLCERLTGGAMPGDGAIAPVLPLELPAGHRGAHAAAIEEPVRSRRTTHRAPDVPGYRPGEYVTTVNGYGPNGYTADGHPSRTWRPQHEPGFR